MHLYDWLNKTFSLSSFRFFCYKFKDKNEYHNLQRQVSNGVR